MHVRIPDPADSDVLSLNARGKKEKIGNEEKELVKENVTSRTGENVHREIASLRFSEIKVVINRRMLVHQAPASNPFLYADINKFLPDVFLSAFLVG